MSDDVEVPAVIVLPDTTVEEVVFTPAQQLKLDGIVKKAMGRAGSDARAEAERLRVENEHLKSIAAGSAPNADEVSRLKAEISAQKLENDAIKATAQRQAKDNLITGLAAKQDFIDADVVLRLTRDNIRAEGSGYTVVDDSGQPRFAADGITPMTPEAFYQEYASQRLYLVKGQVKSGGGGTSSSGSVNRPPGNYQLHELFGPGSSAQLCNKISIQQPALYKQLRSEAKLKGLVT